MTDSLSDLLKQAQKMQSELSKKQKEMKMDPVNFMEEMVN